MPAALAGTRWPRKDTFAGLALRSAGPVVQGASGRVCGAVRSALLNGAAATASGRPQFPGGAKLGTGFGGSPSAAAARCSLLIRS